MLGTNDTAPGQTTQPPGQGPEADSRSKARWRRYLLLALAWLALIGLLWGLDTMTKLDVRNRTGVGLDDFRLFTEQITSAIAAWVMVGFVVWWLERFPLHKDRWPSAVVGHVIGSAIFALGHYLGLVALRIAVHWAVGSRYQFSLPHQLHNWLFEYKKDIKIYLGIVLVIVLYRLLTNFRNERLAASDGPRLVVQTGKGKRFLELSQIEYLQAARNYMVVHAGGQEHLVRETMADMERRLAAADFIRVHRSYLVNFDQVRELLLSGGRQRLVLNSGAEIPVGRAHRDQLQQRLEALDC